MIDSDEGRVHAEQHVLRRSPRLRACDAHTDGSPDGGRGASPVGPGWSLRAVLIVDLGRARPVLRTNSHTLEGRVVSQPKGGPAFGRTRTAKRPRPPACFPGINSSDLTIRSGYRAIYRLQLQLCSVSLSPVEAVVVPVSSRAGRVVVPVLW